MRNGLKALPSLNALAAISGTSGDDMFTGTNTRGNNRWR